MNIKEKAKQLKTDIPTVYLCLKSSRTPFIAKLFALITIVYALSPIDLIPDFIPVLGYLDDIIILPLLIIITIHFIPEETFEYFKREAQGLRESKMQKKWYYSLPIIFIWIVSLYFVIRMFFN